MAGDKNMTRLWKYRAFRYVLFIAVCRFAGTPASTFAAFRNDFSLFINTPLVARGKFTKWSHVARIIIPS